MSLPPDPYAPPPDQPATPRPADAPAPPPSTDPYQQTGQYQQPNPYQQTGQYQAPYPYQQTGQYQASYGAPAPSPGAPWQGTPAAWRPASFGSVTGLGYAVVAVSSVWTLLNLVMAAAAFEAGESNARAAERGEPLPISLYDGLVFFDLPVTIAAFVLSGLWLTGARRNVDQVDRASQRRGVVWAWLGWIVPVVNLWFPYQVVADAGRASGRRTLPYGWWWATWLLWLVLNNAASIAQPDFDGSIEPGLARLLGPLELAGALAMLPALALWLVVVLGITKAQQEWVAGRGPTLPAPQPGYGAAPGYGGQPPQGYGTAPGYGGQPPQGYYHDPGSQDPPGGQPRAHPS